MKDDQLKVLESRISNAITFIENLKSRDKTLLLENEGLNGELRVLKKNLEEKERKIEELLKTQKYLKERIETILTKLEGLASLDRLSQTVPDEALTGEAVPETAAGAGGVPRARLGAGSGRINSAEGTVPQAKAVQSAVGASSESKSGSPGERTQAGGKVIVDENIVDLKEESEKEKPQEPNQKRNPREDLQSKQKIGDFLKPEKNDRTEEKSQSRKKPAVETGNLFDMDDKPRNGNNAEASSQPRWYGNNPFVDL